MLLPFILNVSLSRTLKSCATLNHVVLVIFASSSSSSLTATLMVLMLMWEVLLFACSKIPYTV